MASVLIHYTSLKLKHLCFSGCRETACKTSQLPRESPCPLSLHCTSLPFHAPSKFSPHRNRAMVHLAHLSQTLLAQIPTTSLTRNPSKANQSLGLDSCTADVHILSCVREEAPWPGSEWSAGSNIGCLCSGIHSHRSAMWRAEIFKEEVITVFLWALILLSRTECVLTRWLVLWLTEGVNSWPSTS